MSGQISLEDIAAEMTAERDFHNRAYTNSTPFDLGPLPLDKKKVWDSLKPLYEPGGHVRGQRNRRYFELMDLDSIDGKTVVDFGCGNGSSGLFAALHGANVVGFDISEIGIERANEYARINAVDDHCRFFVGEASDTGLDSGSADLIIIKAVLHHFIKYPGIEDEIWRVLKPGGIVVFADIIRDNAFYNALTRLYRATGVETDHGAEITSADYDRFVSRYENVILERRAFLEGIKRIIPVRMRPNILVRRFVHGLVFLDSALLRSFPRLESQTLEIIGKMQKPLFARKIALE